MKILLLQSSVYFPSYGGGNKSNRLLLEALAQRGHDCYSISKSLNAQTITDPTSEEEALQQREITSSSIDHGLVTYHYKGVNVVTVDTHQRSDMASIITQQYHRLAPDILLVSDDKDDNLLSLALQLSPDKTVLVVHTNLHLPFGREASNVSLNNIKPYQQCQHILTSTQYTKTYLHKEAGINSTYLPFPVFGTGPFINQACINHGGIGMINPCSVKGIDIFVGLAKRFPNLPFLAVPTWGANETDIKRLKQLHNMHIMPPKDDIDEVLEAINILIVPSLIPETFGYVAVEAMLRGIPVLASDLGGLRHAKLGIDYLLPVTPAINQGGHHYIADQDLQPWEDALYDLTTHTEQYQKCSNQSYTAANNHVSKIAVDAFEHYFDSC